VPLLLNASYSQFQPLFMVFCPQSPPPLPASYHTYPSPPSKSPPSVPEFKASRNLPTLKYPLTDITNFTLAQAKLELLDLAPIVPNDEYPGGQARELYGDAPPRRGRGKSRRGRQRGIRAREVAAAMSGGAALRSPIPSAAPSPRSHFHPAFDFRIARRKSKPASPILFNTSSHKFFHDTNNAHTQPPRRRCASVSAVTPETPSNSCKRTKRWTYNSPRGKPIHPPSPPHSTPVTRKPPGSHNLIPHAPISRHQVFSHPPLRFPVPPSSEPAFACSSPHATHEKHFSLIPSMNLGSGIVQAQVRKKRTKRDLAEVQWQITMHKSLAWRTTRDQLDAEKQAVCENCIKAKENASHGMMDFAKGGLKITFEGTACMCASGNEPQTGNRGAQSHWTESHDRELVKRLWVKLIAQGCRTMPTGISNPSKVSTPFPTVEQPQRGIPFPSGQAEQPLAPAIQLSSASPPASHSQIGSGIPPRQRVSAIASSKPHPHVSPLDIHASFPKPCIPITISMPPSSSFTADPTHPISRCQMPQASARIPRGARSSAQLAAQALLRHGDNRLKPMRRGRPPGLKQRESSLRHEVRAERAD